MAITRVQSKTATTGATPATTLNLVFDSTPTDGNCILLAVAGGTSSTSYAQSLTTTNISYWLYQQANGTALWVTLFAGRVFASASATITVNMVASSNIAIAGAEYNGTNIRQDQQVFATGSSTSPASGATATTVNANELWVGVLGARNTNSGTVFSSPTNSFAIVGQTNTTTGTGNADRAVALLERIVTSTGTANAGATSSFNGTWVAMASTFHEIAAGATGGGYTFGS